MKTLFTITLLALAIQLSAAEAATVTGTIVTPKTVKAYAGLELEIRLYEYHPFIADKPADLVAKLSLKGYAHQAGEETKPQFALAVKIKPGMSYYLTCFALDAKGKRQLMGEKDGKRGLCKVLTGGNPQKVTLILRDLRK
jgi:hypothetical protein